MKPPHERHGWIVAYLRDHSTESLRESVDVLNRHFAEGYIDFSDAPCAVMPFGAPKCPQLGRDLSNMHRRQMLTRRPVGLEGLTGMGFPRWVYSYQLKKGPTP